MQDPQHRGILLWRPEQTEIPSQLSTCCMHAPGTLSQPGDSATFQAVGVYLSLFTEEDIEAEGGWTSSAQDHTV